MKNGHSTILFALTRIFTRLLLILTEAHDYVVLGSWYWCVIFTHKFFGFNWGQSYLATPQNFPKCFIFFNTLHIFASDQIKEEGNKIFFLSNFRHKKQFLTLFLQVFSNFWRNYWKLFEKWRETGGKSTPSLSLVFGTFKFRWSGWQDSIIQVVILCTCFTPTKKNIYQRGAWSFWVILIL